MKFVKIGKNYLIKNSNGRIVSEKEKLELENKELVIQDIKSDGCVKEITKKINKNKKRIKELENNKLEDYIITTEDLDINGTGVIIPNGKVVLKKLETAQEKKEDGADDIIEETNKSI